MPKDERRSLTFMVPTKIAEAVEVLAAKEFCTMSQICRRACQGSTRGWLIDRKGISVTDPTAFRHSLYGIYIALTAAMPAESADKAKEILRGFLKDDLLPEERAIYEILIDDEPTQERPRPKLRVISGGQA
jgi:hypothetical protein